jgi:hypothetical protein
MRTKCTVQSVVTFNDLGLVLQVDRGDGWAMLAHQATGQSLGVFLRDSAGLSWMVKENADNPPTEVWAVVATMI